MSNHEAIKQIEAGLNWLGFRHSGPKRWEVQAAGALLAVTLVDGAQPYLRGEWTDGRARDVVFFELTDGDGIGLYPGNGVLGWAGWYMAGNHLTERGTIGYINEERAAA